MTFGTLLSSQGTDASFGTSPEAPPGASLRCFRLYQIRLPVPIPAGGALLSPARAFRRFHHRSGFPSRHIIEPARKCITARRNPPPEGDHTK
ncbi:hypothetical protein CUT44_17180 [Streptomyces carminius]|uniref:Uncharacterized protein n=1 Tax=Streptomyces carminius TaxID=2665496 RepID=A0A2M8LWD6_9ACTN|nr:hypothetical protein CUT44_17180 [Streptomyces carminius]